MRLPTRITKAVGFAVLLAGINIHRLAAATSTCESLAKLELPGTSITTAASLLAGNLKLPDGRTLSDLPAFCRVAGVIKPTGDSQIQFEVWLPASGWNSKYHGFGNGGYAGAINYSDMRAGLLHGYVSASTDTGHQGTATDASWALAHPEKIIDFGYRAIHEMTVQAKAITRAFYGESPRNSFFSSCSNGGRQALMEAQRYPEDYDGIIAGAPANFWTHLLTSSVWDMVATVGTKDTYIPAAKLPAIEAAALAACDLVDGVKDGVIENPLRCTFDPSPMLCPGTETNDCLTPLQISALKKIYSGARTGSGKPLFPGYAPGGEAEPGGWGPWITGAAPEQSLSFLFGTQFFKNMVFQNPSWDFRTFKVDQDMATADAKYASILNATDADLSRFRAHHGKLIMYHGWSDAAIPPRNAIDYYQSITAKMGADETRAFVRLFMVPGMQHCSGGPGPDEFGQLGIAVGDGDHDMGTALERWLGGGAAPERIIATSNPKSTAPRTRPLCAYPTTARYKGTGSTDDSANFTCAE